MQANIQQTVEGLKNQLVTLLQGLIRIPSENPPGDYSEISLFLEKELMILGFEVEIIEVPSKLVAKMEKSKPRRNVIATLKGSEAGRNLIFNAHIDTVPVGNVDKWSYPPYSGHIEKERIYGRGATDSKGRLAAYIIAAIALKKSGLPFKGSITIAATCDEETGGVLGSGFVAEQGIVSGDSVIVEGYSNQIVRATAGVLQLKIISKGVPAHAGFKWKGVNALEKMTKIIEALAAYQKELENQPSSIPGMKYTTVNIGTISGGTKINVVPDLCSIEVDFRVIPEQSIEAIYKRVKALIQQLAEEDQDMIIEIEKIPDFETEPTVISEDSPLITAIQEANKEVTGQTLPVVGMMGQTDARWYINNGIPSINFGPGTNENHLHGYDEYMDIKDLLQTTKVLSVLARNFLA
ncbi:succinyl-diaminopimelate desuccinylase [Pullulanibacillus camelliae]|uniref:Probable succinyl-diaminopimelate desuccinylase n=1 Tax=Pullulanibacillus camelliae TaxID=1707096 RepID=A0A8J2YIM4_9BACL|nr:ArgE/DapE family deacylase [Pullulanibacillus camelliae]GGE45134.1 succinyl-diaminopimelate desuccinylase [Pullulanibacillus camelliae]